MRQNCYTFFIFVGLFSIIIGCNHGTELDKHTTDFGGVDVGNALRSYSSVRYKFQIVYSSLLTMEAKSPEEFSVDNGRLVDSQHKGSKLRFNIYPNGLVNNESVKDFAGLRNYLVRAYPNRVFSQRWFNGIPTLVLEDKIEDGALSEYYLLTPKGDLVDVHMEVHSVGKGADLIPPVMRSFTYDEEPPSLLDLKTERSEVSEEIPLKLIFQASDHLTGLASKLRANLYSREMSLSSGGVGSYTKHAMILVEIKEIGPNTYEALIPISGHYRPGEYILGAISLFDRVGNERELVAALGDGNVLQGEKYLGGDVPISILRFRVFGRGDSNSRSEDKNWTGPILARLYLSPERILAGSSFKVNFTLKDKEIKILPFLSYWGEFIPVDLTPARLRIPLKGELQTSVDGLHTLTGQTSRYMPTGEYYLENLRLVTPGGKELNLKSTPHSASGTPAYYEGNGEVRLPVIRLFVQNDGLTDIDPPKVNFLRLETPQIHAGEDGKITVNAIDNGSGIANVITHPGIFRPNFNSRTSTRIIFPTHLVSKGEDTYLLQFHTEKNLEPGEYVLSSFFIADVAGNFEHLEVSEPTFYHFRGDEYYSQKGEKKQKVLKLHILPALN